MTLEDLAERYRLSMPGADLVCEYEAGVPVYKTQLKVSLSRRLEIPTIPQFALQLIENGQDSESTISDALGLGAKFVRNALAHLDQLQLARRKFDHLDGADLIFTATERGKEALEQILTAVETEHVALRIDGFTGEFSSVDSSILASGADLKKEGILLLKPVQGTRPELDKLNDRIKDLNLYLQSEISRKDEQYDLIEILAIERSILLYKRVNVLVYRDRQSEKLEFSVFEGLEPIDRYSQALTRHERNGKQVIPSGFLTPISEAIGPSELFAKLQPQIEKLEQIASQERHQLEGEVAEISSQLEMVSASDDIELADKPDATVPITEKTARIRELEVLLEERTVEWEKLRQQSPTSRVLRASEHRAQLLKAIKSAKERVIIISPWITRVATDKEVLKAIRAAVVRNVWIVIGYGMPLRRDESPEDHIDSDVKQELDRIAAESQGKYLHVEWLGSTHEKILVCDSRFCVVTSFNWLSYRGDKGFRREQGVYSKESELISEVAKTTIAAFKSLPAAFLADLGSE